MADAEARSGAPAPGRAAGKEASGGAAKGGAAPAGAPKKGGGGKSGRRKAGRREMGRELARELLKLRPLLREVSAAVQERLDGQLAGLALMLAGEDLHGDPPPLPEGRVLESLLSEVRHLKVKPRKGRVKDLARLDAFLKALAERIPPGA
jgi:hypothetical protein